jgi:hypothetical protein
MPYSHGVRFEPEVPFVNLRSRLTSTAHIKQLDLDHCMTKACLASPPVLRRGRAGALLDVSTRRLQNSSVVKKCSGTRPENWREEGNHGHYLKRPKRLLAGLTYEYLLRKDRRFLERR